MILNGKDHHRAFMDLFDEALCTGVSSRYVVKGMRYLYMYCVCMYMVLGSTQTVGSSSALSLYSWLISRTSHHETEKVCVVAGTQSVNKYSRCSYDLLVVFIRGNSAAA